MYRLTSFAGGKACDGWLSIFGQKETHKLLKPRVFRVLFFPLLLPLPPPPAISICECVSMCICVYVHLHPHPHPHRRQETL